MKSICICLVAVVICLAGCTGVNINPISVDNANTAHAGNTKVRGYIVYEPVVVVEVSQKDVCVAKDDKGNCKKQGPSCSAGAPFVLPDYTKPYSIDIKNGFGKAGVEITINDGWRLGTIKDNSDNTAVLGAIENLAVNTILKMSDSEDIPVCNKPGLYRVAVDNNKISLIPLLYY